ncbi:MAG: DUF6580 family putative transport protein [Acidobacteriaceae bacterium]
MGAYLLIVVAVLSRVVVSSHLQWLNFTAVGASLLYFGARRPMREAVWAVLAMMGSDFLLTTYGYGYPWHTSHYLVTWAWYAAAIVLGRVLLSRRVNVSRLAAAPVLASTSFFAVSNFAVWAGGVLYPHTLAGLGTCYIAGLPFYRNDLLSTIAVTAVVFGIEAMARRMAEQRQHRLAA